MTKKSKCCLVQTVFGQSLCRGIVFVGSISCVISVVFFVYAILTLIIMTNKETLYGKEPQLAIDIIMALTFSPMSLYQFAISVALIYQAVKLYGNVFICSLWFTSNVTIMLVYLTLFVARVIACVSLKDYSMAGITIFVALLYGMLYIYFAIAVNSYRHAIQGHSYYI